MNLYDEGYNDGIEYSEKNYENKIAEITKKTNQLPSVQEHFLESTKRFLRVVNQGSPMEIAQLERNTTIDTAIKSLSLVNVSKNLNEELVISGLITLILRTSAFFNIGKPMNEDQAIETAYLLLDKYPHESFEDFVIMFRNAKTGKYGELYNRLDGQIIFKWMGEYLEEKAAHREKLHRALKFSDQTLNVQEVVQNHVQEQKLLETKKTT